jgi:hypothetical protein
MVLLAFLASHCPGWGKKLLLLGQHNYEEDYSFPNYRVEARTAVTSAYRQHTHYAIYLEVTAVNMYYFCSWLAM